MALFPLWSSLALSYPMGYVVWALTQGMTLPTALGYGVGQLGWLLVGASLLVGRFPVLRLHKRWKVLLAGISVLAFGTFITPTLITMPNDARVYIDPQARTYVAPTCANSRSLRTVVTAREAVASGLRPDASAAMRTASFKRIEALSEKYSNRWVFLPHCRLAGTPMGAGTGDPKNLRACLMRAPDVGRRALRA